MKIPFTIAVVATAFALLSASAVEPEKLASNPARIVADSMDPAPLVISDSKKGWSEIPGKFAVYGAAIFKPERDQLGVAKFRVIEDGYLLLACNFDYQGNSSGNWRQDVISEDEFVQLGWKKLKGSKSGGPLIQADGREQTIFFRKVRAGERFNLRCNKYDPPYPILLRRADLEKGDRD